MAIITSPSFVDYHTFIPPPEGKRAVQWSLDSRRATIFFNRAKAGSYGIFGNSDPNTRDHSVITPAHKALEVNNDKIKFGDGTKTSLSHKELWGSRGVALEDYVAIVDIDVNGYDKGKESIILPFIPKEVNWNSASNYVAIKPIGANNPRYQFTGAEDKVEFEIDWHSHNEDRRDVITKCRKLEALSKADGYTRNPHRVMLHWGFQNALFATQVFIVTAAPYRLVQFSKGHHNRQGALIKTHMLPVQAYQQVTLSRITSKNLSTKDIEFVDDTQYTSIL